MGARPSADDARLASLALVCELQPAVCNATAHEVSFSPKGCTCEQHQPACTSRRLKPLPVLGYPCRRATKTPDHGPAEMHKLCPPPPAPSSLPPLVAHSSVRSQEASPLLLSSQGTLICIDNRTGKDEYGTPLHTS